MYSFYVDQEINCLLSEDYRETHRVYFMNAFDCLLSEIIVICPVNWSFQEHHKL
jgi:hypothetical protein